MWQPNVSARRKAGDGLTIPLCTRGNKQRAASRAAPTVRPLTSARNACQLAEMAKPILRPGSAPSEGSSVGVWALGPDALQVRTVRFIGRPNVNRGKPGTPFARLAADS